MVKVYLPLALCKVFLDLSTDRLMNVLLQGGIPSNPDTQSRKCVLVNVQRVKKKNPIKQAL